MKRIFLLAAAAVATAPLAAAPGCGSGFNLDLALPDAGLPEGGNLTAPRGVGERCDEGGVCRPGLACTAGACQPGRSSPAGAKCVISAECVADHYCGPAQTCAPAGAGASGAACKGDGDCKAGLRCNLVDFSTLCQPEGTKDVGGDCAVAGDCFGGLVCAGNKCIQAPPGGVVPPFQGVNCETETGDATAYFDVPRGDAALKDYFRLPYPNDIRTANGKPKMKDFPTPGSAVLGYDLVKRWADFLEASPNVTGFSTYPTTIFRFSSEIDFASLEPKGTTFYIDLTTKEELGHNWSTSSGRSAYICPNSLSFRPPTGGALRAGHTYGVFFTTGVKAKDGKPVARSADLTALLATSDPGGDLSAAWKQYQPLRDWAAAKSFALADILNAAVFTVGKHDQVGKDLGSNIEKSTAPKATEWTKCGSGKKSPCAQADGERACPATPVNGIDEWHALITLPLFQQGKVPYLAFGDDGSFLNKPTTETVQVCAAVTVPAGATGNLPTVIYAHGTGGSFRSHTSADNVGTRMAAKGIAVLGIDQVGHGTRRGTSNADASLIFFNFANPPAAQGNVLQGAADQVALAQLLKKGLPIEGGNVTLGGTAKIAYWGHSQGATEGAIGMPYASDVAGVVFSGQGGSLIDSLLTKTSPIDFASLAPSLLSELPANVNASHPVLSMFQNAIDPADPLDHAFNATQPANVAERIVPKHVFVPYGQLDTFSTPITQLTYIAAAGLDVAAPPTGVTPDKLHRDPIPSVAGNKNTFTAATRQYAKPAASDGHFVAFRDPAARKDVDTFLERVLKGGGVPTIPAP